MTRRYGQPKSQPKDRRIGVRGNSIELSKEISICGLETVPAVRKGFPERPHRVPAFVWEEMWENPTNEGVCR